MGPFFLHTVSAVDMKCELTVMELRSPPRDKHSLSSAALLLLITLAPCEAAGSPSTQVHFPPLLFLHLEVFFPSPLRPGE